MRIVFIHAGKAYHKHLGSHYGPLIEHSLHLISILDYLQSPKLKNKYRPIQSLPVGVLIGIALIDTSYFCTPAHIQTDPWTHGPYCYHIKDTLRLPQCIQDRGQMGPFKLSRPAIQKIKAMPNVMATITQWQHTYDINAEWNIFTGLTIMQPFAEAIIRRIKCVENRGSKVLGVIGESEGEFEGCRVCLGRKMDLNLDSLDYAKYGTEFVKKYQERHTKLPKYVDSEKWNWHRNEKILSQCGCKKMRKGKKRKKGNVCENSQNSQKSQNKAKKTKMKPLHEWSHNKPRRKASKKRRLNRSTYFIPKRKYNLRKDSNREKVYSALVTMGFGEKNARIASDKHSNLTECTEYLLALGKVSNGHRKGYSEKLSKINQRKRKRDEMECDSDSDLFEPFANRKRRKTTARIDPNKNYKLQSNESESSPSVASDYEDLLKVLEISKKTHKEETELREAIAQSQIPRRSSRLNPTF